ncbi:hypothetical protein [Parasphingorhabdus sp.]|uniref:hypothetical protein n=1 Tax=Parasphingorhabdus sp. TaxID=2709688 RepID=UPI003BB09828
MSYEIKKAKDQIGQDMPHSEYSIDQALVSVSNLMSTLVNARLNTGVPASTGQAAILRLAKAQMALVDASSDILRVHGELKKIGKEYAWGDTHEDCPPAAQASDKDGKRLSIVA